jgi:DNA-binding transcriptional ArsR family regulator
MLDMPDIASVAAVVGERTRGRMLTALMDGRARTATELALAGGVTASTASSHLARLANGGFVTLVKQGRHRYYRLSGTEVAAVIEGLVGIAPRNDNCRSLAGPLDARLRHARVCYDHLAGESAVCLLRRMRETELLHGGDPALALTRQGETWCTRVGIDVGALRKRRRPLCRTCLDWTERRAHLAGALGAAILERLFELRYAKREIGSRAVILSPRAESFLQRLELVC